MDRLKSFFFNLTKICLSLKKVHNIELVQMVKLEKRDVKDQLPSGQNVLQASNVHIGICGQSGQNVVSLVVEVSSGSEKLTTSSSRK